MAERRVAATLAGLGGTLEVLLLVAAAKTGTVPPQEAPRLALSGLAIVLLGAAGLAAIAAAVVLRIGGARGTALITIASGVAFAALVATSFARFPQAWRFALPPMFMLAAAFVKR